MPAGILPCRFRAVLFTRGAVFDIDEIRAVVAVIQRFAGDFAVGEFLGVFNERHAQGFAGSIVAKMRILRGCAGQTVAVLGEGDAAEVFAV